MDEKNISQDRVFRRMLIDRLDRHNELLGLILEELQIKNGTKDKDAILKMLEQFKPKYSYYPDNHRDLGQLLNKKGLNCSDRDSISFDVKNKKIK